MKKKSGNGCIREKRLKYRVYQAQSTCIVPKYKQGSLNTLWWVFEAASSPNWGSSHPTGRQTQFQQWESWFTSKLQQVLVLALQQGVGTLHRRLGQEENKSTTVKVEYNYVSGKCLKQKPWALCTSETWKTCSTASKCLCPVFCDLLILCSRTPEKQAVFTDQTRTGCYKGI